MIQLRKQFLLQKKEFELQYTPDLRTYLRSWNIYVGDGSKFGRVDNIIEIPLAICNKSYGLAKDIKLTILYNDGASGDRNLSQGIPVLKGTETLALPSFAPSILASAPKTYLSNNVEEKKTFKMKIFLDWKDASGKEYNSVELLKLAVTESYSDYPSRFIFESKSFYDSLNRPEEFKKYSKKEIDF